MFGFSINSSFTSPSTTKSIGIEFTRSECPMVPRSFNCWPSRARRSSLQLPPILDQNRVTSARPRIRCPSCWLSVQTIWHHVRCNPMRINTVPRVTSSNSFRFLGWDMNGLPITMPRCGISSGNIHWPKNVDAAEQSGEPERPHLRQFNACRIGECFCDSVPFLMVPPAGYLGRSPLSCHLMRFLGLLRIDRFSGPRNQCYGLLFRASLKSTGAQELLPLATHSRKSRTLSRPQIYSSTQATSRLPSELPSAVHSTPPSRVVVQG